VSPRTPDQQTRSALIDAAARLLAHEGSAALTTRRLAAEVGSSTMAVYTHFGGMDGLRRTVRMEGFAQLGGRFASVPTTRDPVADLSALGWAYCYGALANPQLYRAIFAEAPVDPDDAAVARSALEHPIGTVARCIEAGRFRRADPEALAIQLWVAAHGMIMAVLAQILTLDDVIEHFSTMARNLYAGFGDDPIRAKRSIARAQRRMQPPGIVRSAS
jgi:AcrR family transcriptional regulator